MRYEEMLQKEAEKIARLDQIRQFGYDRFEQFDEDTKKEIANEYLSLACHVLAEKASIVKDTWQQAQWTTYIDLESSERQAEDYAIELGLIEEKK